jgi:hypothetical protein
MTVHRCIAEHSVWVEAAYTNQPSSVEAKEAYWEQHRDAIVACLRAEGIDVEGDEPISDLKRIAVYAEDSGETDVDCLGPGYADQEAGG